jgi:hypothetical protein
MQVPTAQTDAMEQIDEHNLLLPDRAGTKRDGIETHSV